MDENLENLKHVASQLFHEKRWDELILVCNEIIDLAREPHAKAHAHVHRGLAYLQKHHYDQAIADFTKALELKVDYAEAYCERGVAYAFNNSLDQAIADLTKALELKVGYADAYHNLGIVYDLKGDLDQAIVNFKEALEIEPDDAESQRGYGLALSKKGDHGGAIAHFNESIRLRPKHSMSYVDRGITYEEMDDYDRAIDDFSTAINLDHTNRLAWHNRGVVRRHRGQTYTQRGMTSDSLEEFDKAIHDLTEAIRLNPKEASSYSGRGSAYIEKGKYDLALADFVSADKCDPHLKMRAPAVYIALQMEALYKQSGQKDDKETAFKFYFELFKTSDAVKRKRFFGPKAEVAHYTSLHTLKILATNGRFRFYNAAYMNDPEEGRVFFEIMKGYAIDVQEVFYGDEAPPYPSSAYIGSFIKVDAQEPEEKDKLFLWRTYGKHDEQEATGACLIFKHEGTVFAESCGTQIGAMQQLQSKLPIPAGDTSHPEKGQSQKPELFKIVYGEKESNQELSDELKQLAESLKQIDDYISDRDAGIQAGLKQLARELLDTVRFLFKASHYREEMEVRVVQIRYYDENMTQETDDIKVDAKQIPPRFFLETHDNFRFSEVILGPKARHIEEWQRWLKQQEHNNAEQSKIKYGTKYI